jgi:hypothetical protein
MGVFLVYAAKNQKKTTKVFNPLAVRPAWHLALCFSLVTLRTPVFRDLPLSKD